MLEDFDPERCVNSGTVKEDEPGALVVFGLGGYSDPSTEGVDRFSLVLG